MTTITAGDQVAVDRPTADAQVGVERHESRAVSKVLGLATLLAAAAAVMVANIGDVGLDTTPSSWWAVALIALTYGVAEHQVFHLELRREAITFSLSEVPTAFALALLGPLPAIAARIIGSIGVITATTRPAAYKLVFNGALFAFEAALAFTIVRGLSEDTSGADFLIAAAIGISVATMLGSMAVAAAVSCFEGDVVRHLAQELRVGSITGPVSAAIAAVAVAPALFDVRLAVLSIVPVGAVWLVMLRHGRLGQSHRDLEALHDFAGIVGASLHPDELVPAALDEAMRVLRAGTGGLVVFDNEGDVAIRHVVGDTTLELPSHRDDPAWSSILDPAAEIAGDDKAQTCAVPVRDVGGLVGVLVVTQRRGVADRFDESDVERARRIAEQLAVGLRNSLLHADMQRAALTDMLTGRANRVAFDQLVSAALTGPRTPGTAVLMIDLDRFKEVNDTLGHQIGDVLLRQFADRVDALLRPDELLARFGGDEFALYVDRGTREGVDDLVNALLNAAYEPMHLEGFDLVVTASIGIAPVTSSLDTPPTLVRRADIAMYTAKRRHSGFAWFEDHLDLSSPARLSLLADLREAFRHDDIVAHFQPKIDLATQRVVGVESLARWHHAERGWVDPAEFVPVAEESGFIRALTDHMVAASLEAARSWLDQGHDLHVAVNLAGADLLDDQLPERIEQLLRAHGVGAQRLRLEITESSVMADIQRTMATLDRLHELGVILSLDDFGTGYSSLSYLRQLPVTELKIDRSFLADLLTDRQGQVIVRSTIELAQNLGLQVVAEGIENGDVIELVRSYGCDLGQGHAISMPLDREALTRLLNDRVVNERVVNERAAAGYSAASASASLSAG